MKKIRFLYVIVLTLGVGLLVAGCSREEEGLEERRGESEEGRGESQERGGKREEVRAKREEVQPPRSNLLASAANAAVSRVGLEGEGGEEGLEGEEAAATAAVDAFDALTDEWMETRKGGVTMDDVQKFTSYFRKLPSERRDECIHRALNLIPDENALLLAGVLMDKEMDKEIVETVFNDILNRDETVKKPLLRQIFKDKTHPCWADTAWILDVTGELPGKKE